MKKNISIIYFLLFVYNIANAQDSLYFRANAYKEQLDNYYSMDEKDFPKPGSILFIGSSSLGMWKNTGSYFPNHRVLNRAYGGSWISDYLYHYQRLVVAYKPAQIVLLCGANDLYNGVSIERVFEDIKYFCRLLDIHLPGVPVILLSFHPSPSMPDWIPKEREVNKLIQDYFKDSHQVTYVDITSCLYDKNGALPEKFYISDRLHPSVLAYKEFAKIIEPYLINNK